MKKCFALLFSIVCLASSLFAQPKNLSDGLNDLSGQISRELSDNQKRKIAVVEFVDLRGSVTDLGRYLSEKLITKLFQTKKFTVIERQQLNRIISEQKLSLTGVIDPTAAQKLGKLLGVDAIAAGSVSDLTKTLEINARLISTETGEVFSAASVEIVKDETVCNLMGGCKDNPSSGRLSPEKAKSWTVKSNFFTFELFKCRISGDSVICELSITNDDTDRRVRISHNRTKLFDDLGNEFRAGEMKFGNFGFDITLSGDYQSGAIISGVTVSGRIIFNNVSIKASKITLLKIEVSNGDNTFNIEYRNIPLLENS